MDNIKLKDGIWKWLYSFAKHKGNWLFINIISSFLSVLIDIFGVYLITQMVQRILESNQSIDFNIIYYLLGLLVIGMGTKYIAKYSAGYFATSMSKNLKNKVLDRILSLSIGDVEKQHSGEMLSKISNDIGTIEEFFTNKLPNLLYTPLIILSSIIYLTFIDWKLVIVSFISMPVALVLSRIISRPMEKYAHAYQEQLGYTNSIMQDNISGVDVIKSYGIRDYMLNKYKKSLKETLRLNLRLSKQEALMMPTVIISYEIPYVLSAVFGGYFALRGELEAYNLVAFIQLLGLFIGPLNQLPDLISSIPQVKGCATGLYKLYHQPVENISKAITQNSYDRNEKAVKFDKVSFAYSDKNVLKDCSFVVEKGQKVAIVGESGCGKSTIINLICGFYKAQKGNISILNHILYETSIEEIRKCISLVSQEPYLFSGTIEDNVRYGKLTATKEEIMEACKKANIHEYIMSLKEGYQTIISERGNNFSGGEKQRISIARAILKDAPILLLDEPTSALDSKSEAFVQEAIDYLTHQRTTIVVAHRMSTIINSDKIMLIDQGKVIAQGTHLTLLEECDKYKLLYQKLNDIEVVGGAKNE